MAILRYAAAGTLGIALGLWAAVPAAGAATEIGTTAIATNKVTGALQKTVRDLKSGDGVFQSETIDTGIKSKAQLMFSDETSLTIGPTSSVVLSKFVYDPNKSSGQVVVNAVKGGLRFITGSLDKKSYKINTPVATLGVRGTIVELQLQGKWLIVSVFEGGVDMCNKVGRCTFLKPGTYAITDGNEMSEARALIGHGGTVFVDTPNPLFQATLGPAPTPLVSIAPEEVVEPPIVEKKHHHHHRRHHHHYRHHRKRHHHHHYAFFPWWKHHGHDGDYDRHRRHRYRHKYAYRWHGGPHHRWEYKRRGHRRFVREVRRFKAWRPHGRGFAGRRFDFRRFKSQRFGPRKFGSYKFRPHKFGPHRFAKGGPHRFGRYADRDAIKKFSFGRGGPGGHGRRGRH
jgi:hypothetical protein